MIVMDDSGQSRREGVDNRCSVADVRSRSASF